jgi:alkanesulfonate monooxygenase SsuD/methylene tetrahydromethanopterin reductase-like flavin-dependent oxidoreductase (luciferase family)
VGGKSRGLIEVAAKHGDYYNAYGVTLEQFATRMENLRDASKRLARNVPVGSIAASGLVRQSQTELSAAISRYKPGTVNVDEYASKGIIGTVDDCIRRLEGYVNAGSEYFIFDFPDMPDLISAKIFMREVAPSFT